MGSLFATPISALTAGNKQAESLSKTIASSGAIAGPSFQTYLVSSASGGVSSKDSIQLNSVGTPAASSTAENFAIAGQGFSVVRNLPGNTSDGTGTLGFTRIGTFRPDAAGNMVNSEGQYLQVFLLDQTTGAPLSSDVSSTANLVTLSTGGLVQAANATTSAAVKTQLSAQATAGDEFPQTIQVFDSLGVQHAVTLTWTKIATPTVVGGQALPAGATQYWKLVIATPDGTVTAGALDGSDYSGTTGSNKGFVVAFDNSGNPVQWGYPVAGGATPTPPTNPPNIGITWAGGSAAASSIALNLGTIGNNDGITSLGAQSKIISSPVVDGSSGGTFKSMSITADGTVNVTFTNDKSYKYARIPLAMFNNPNGLLELSPGVYGVSGQSGDYQLAFPGVNGSGTLSTGMYESSANDSTKAYISLIEASRYFSNNVKVIQVAQKMYDKLDQI